MRKGNSMLKYIAKEFVKRLGGNSKFLQSYGPIYKKSLRTVFIRNSKKDSNEIFNKLIIKDKK